MKNFIILIAVFGLFISPAIAQTDANLRYHEFGINFSSLNNFGLRYKFGNGKTMLRVSLLAVNLQSSNKQGQESDSSKIKQTGYGAGLRIGFDHKIPLFSTFNLLLGAELVANYSYQHQHTEYAGDTPIDITTSAISPGISFIFGANYILKDHLVLGAEINPTLLYIYSTSKQSGPNSTEAKNVSKQLTFALATSGAGIYIAYRFGK
jgi:opacity protein-like surface antigen